MNFKTRCLVISGCAVTQMWMLPAFAVALSTTGPAQPLPALATPATLLLRKNFTPVRLARAVMAAICLRPR